jgi:hypothetical protein
MPEEEGALDRKRNFLAPPPRNNIQRQQRPQRRFDYGNNNVNTSNNDSATSPSATTTKAAPMLIFLYIQVTLLPARLVSLGQLREHDRVGHVHELLGGPLRECAEVGQLRELPERPSRGPSQGLLLPALCQGPLRSHRRHGGEWQDEAVLRSDVVQEMVVRIVEPSTDFFRPYTKKLDLRTVHFDEHGDPG